MINSALMKGSIALFATTAAGLTIACVHLSKQIDLARTRAVDEQSLRDRLEARFVQLERDRVRLAARTDVALRSDESTTQRAPASARAQSAGSGDALQRTARSNFEAQMTFERNRAEARRKRLQDPQTRALMRAEAKAEFRAEYHDLERAIGLTPHEYEQFLDLRAALRIESWELDSGELDAFAATFEAQQRREQEQIAALFGEEKARRYDEYVRSMPARRLAQQFETRLSEQNALSDDQRTRLIAALHSASQRSEDDVRDVTGQMRVGYFWGFGLVLDSESPDASVEEQALRQLERYNEYVRQSAAGVLTTQQWREYEQFQSDQAASVRLSIRQMMLHRNDRG